jgi:3-hydroxyacyl-CoA dehydrogenase
MQIEDVRRIAIVGAGTMGQQIGFQCAGHGYDVVVYDINPPALNRRGRDRPHHRSAGRRPVERGSARESQTQGAGPRRVQCGLPVADDIHDQHLAQPGFIESPDP